MDFSKVQYVVDYIISTDESIVIPASVLSGYASLVRSLNAAGDLVPGSVNTATLDFIVLELSGAIKDYTGKKFRYIKGYAEAETFSRCPYVCDHYVANADATWLAYSRKKQLTVRTSDAVNTYTLESEPGCLVVKDGYLIALYPDTPFAEKYGINGATLTGPVYPDLSAYEQHIASAYARHKQSYYCSDNTMIQYAVTYLSNVRSIIQASYQLYQKGIFIANRPERGTGSQYTISCVDAMSLFDADRVDVLNTIGESTTAGALLTTLCTYANVALAEQTRLNENFIVTVPADIEAITGAELLRYLGEIMGCSWRINAEGKLESAWYTFTSTQLTLSDYQTFQYGTYEVAPIDRVTANSAYAEVFGGSGTGSNILNISDNNLIPATTKDELDAFCATLLTAVSGVPAYVPGTVSGYANPEIIPGHIISVQSEDLDYEKFCIVQTTENGFVETYEATGNESRVVDSISTLSSTSLKSTIQDTTEYPSDWKADIQAESNRITGAAGGNYKVIFSSEKPAGFYVLQDSEVSAEASKLWRFDSSGLSWLENGVDGPVTRQILTSDGYCNAGALSGIIESGSSSWNLSTGAAVLKNLTVGANNADLSNAKFQDVTINGTVYTILVKGA